MLQFGTPVQRILAYIIDVMLFWAVFLGYVLIFFRDEEGRILFLSKLFSPEVLIYWILFFPVSEILTGKTIGKHLMKLRVVDAHGNEEMQWWQPVVRHLMDIIDLAFFGLVAVLSMGRSDTNQRIGDKVAGTWVIRHVELACTQCGTKSVLSTSELKTASFQCPECGFQND